MYKQLLALNKLQELICHKTHPTNQLPDLFEDCIYKSMPIWLETGFVC